MRIAKSPDALRGYLTAVAVSEPMLAIAAMYYLNASEEARQKTITTLVEQFFNLDWSTKAEKARLPVS
jgi:hypothetical protein